LDRFIAGLIGSAVVIFATNAALRHKALSEQLTHTATSTISQASSPAPSGVSICGKQNDRTPHLSTDSSGAINRATFLAPPKNQSYLDPVLGCTVKCLTDATRIILDLFSRY
jgi:hypothetical protein